MKRYKITLKIADMKEWECHTWFNYTSVHQLQNEQYRQDLEEAFTKAFNQYIDDIIEVGEDEDD